MVTSDAHNNRAWYKTKTKNYAKQGTDKLSVPGCEGRPWGWPELAPLRNGHVANDVSPNTSLELIRSIAPVASEKKKRQKLVDASIPCSYYAPNSDAFLLLNSEL